MAIHLDTGMRTISILQPSFKSLFLSLRFRGTELATATGFIVKSKSNKSKHLLITNRHNMTGKNNITGDLLSKTGGIPDEIAIWHNLHGKLGQWVKLIEPLYNDNKPLWLEHPKLGIQADVVALPLTNIEGIDLHPYDLDEKTRLQPLMPSDITSVVGFPFGLSTGGRFAIWVTGFVASEPNLDFPYFLIDCRTRKGQSGSPVIAQRNGGAIQMAGGGVAIGAGNITEFLGVYSGRVNEESDIGIVWKASTVKELVDSI